MAPTESLITGVFTLLGTLVGAGVTGYISYRNNKITIQAENKRRSADYLLQKEADALIDLMSKGENCHAVTQQLASQASSGIDDQLLNDANQALAEFEQSYRTNSIFLPPEVEDSFNELLAQVRIAQSSAYQLEHGRPNIAHEQMDWVKFAKSIEDVQSSLRELLNDRINDLREQNPN